MARQILKQGDVDIEADDVRIVQLAGLTHDLGHGPMSHGFDNFVKRCGVTGWSHEEMSGKILELLQENADMDLDSDDVRRIKELVHGMPPEHLAPERQGGGGLWRAGRRFLFDIVANKRNGVDVDKVDYLARDSLMCGVRVGCDFDRLIKKGLYKVLDDEVCYPWSEYGNVLDLFRAREQMHRKVYTNRRCKVVELMTVDALLAADPLLRLTERLDDPEEFLALDDTILTTIEHYHRLYRGNLDDREEKALREAQAIVLRMRRREMYRFGNQFTVPIEYLVDKRWESMRRLFTPEEVASCYRGCDLPGGLQPGDVICDENKIDHTMGGANPAERVGFFKEGSGGKFYISDTQVVGIMPSFFQERVLRVFTQHTDERYIRAIEQALDGWRQKHFGGRAQLATPRYSPPKRDESS
ncbi:hypothetical protein GPECTOR_1g836 [Gonium pectorale]|uniref:HD domain-containing protein n=1 Tax=Gonium pectorale TaxID=33097 RepID=A0A150H456_GONPE|nr:hypothetical protein GPECTOR_1g836 [Gonium pectorale]|eukprot:KXZ56927.1 hypothetical protein GPECTOR_1g836 [Gonium pectorale]